MKISNIISRVNKFREYKNARSHMNNSLKPSIVLHGDDGMYWVCRLSDAERLIKSGYEVAPDL